jgi:hypothetical protein
MLADSTAADHVGSRHSTHVVCSRAERPGDTSCWMLKHAPLHAAAALMHTMQPTCAHVPLPLSVQPFLPRLINLKLARLPIDLGSVPVM